MRAPAVALATCAHFPALHPDDQLALPALAAHGIEASAQVWDDPAVAWERFDLVVVRETWDYAPRREEFLRWAGGLARLANSAEVLAWNTDKHYLRELAEAGVPVVRTEWLEPGSRAALPAAGQVVVKPAVSNGSRHTGRYELSDPAERSAALQLAGELLAAGRSVMVQPYLASVDQAGESALVFLAGRFSHAVRKGPMLDGPFRPGVDPHAREQIAPRAPTAEEHAVAAAVLDALPWGRGLLYARVDLLTGPRGTPVLLELELAEPMLFLSHDTGAADRFARAVAEMLA